MEVYLINPEDLKDVTVNINGEMDFKIKRKYGKFNREIFTLDVSDYNKIKCNAMDDTDYNEPLTIKQKEEAYNDGFKICNDIFKLHAKWI
jgi:hypothetical protein